MLDSFSYFSFQPVLHDCYITKDVAYAIMSVKRVVHVVVATGFLSAYLSGSYSFVRRHITVNKMY